VEPEDRRRGDLDLFSLDIQPLTQLAHGLVLVGGTTGSGKSTTIAALVNEINWRDARHIVTIEDPLDGIVSRPPNQRTASHIGKSEEMFCEYTRLVSYCLFIKGAI